MAPAGHGIARVNIERQVVQQVVTPSADTRRGTLVGSTAVLLWSTLAALTTLSGDIPPFQLLAMTFTPAFLVGVGLWVWEARRGRRSAGFLTGSDHNTSVITGSPDADSPDKNPVLQRLRLSPAVWALGIYGLFGYHFAYFMGMRLAPPVEAGLLNYLWPLLIVVFAGFLPEERLRKRQVAGALLGFAGAGLIVTRGRACRAQIVSQMRTAWRSFAKLRKAFPLQCWRNGLAFRCGRSSTRSKPMPSARRMPQFRSQRSV